MNVKTFIRRPVPVKASRYDGTIDSGDALIAWVRNARSQQELYFEGDTQLVLHGPEGTTDVYEGWWLVKHHEANFFEVLTSDELDQKYEERG